MENDPVDCGIRRFRHFLDSARDLRIPGGLGTGVQNFLNGFYASEKLPESAAAKTSEIPAGRAIPLPENKDPVDGSGAALPEMQPDPQTDAPASPEEKTGSDETSLQLPENDIQIKKPAASLFNPKSVVVGKGDTLIGIASRFFPGNKADGVQKILSTNPTVDDKNRIYSGQILVIPEAGSDRTDFN
jgi:nucleoid-associated protein YgaU